MTLSLTLPRFAGEGTNHGLWTRRTSSNRQINLRATRRNHEIVVQGERKKSFGTKTRIAQAEPFDGAQDRRIEGHFAFIDSL